MSEEKISPSAWRKIIIAVISVLKAVLRGLAKAKANDNENENENDNDNDDENRPKGGHEHRLIKI